MNLRDAIDQDKFIIDDITYTDAELREMSADSLETLKMLINKKISGLSAAIKQSKVEYATSGKRASNVWFSKTKLSLSINQRVLTYVNSLLKKRRRTISDYFMSQAKADLKPNQYESILNGAYREMEAVEGGRNVS